MPQTLLPLTAGVVAPVLASWLCVACGEPTDQSDDHHSLDLSAAARIEIAISDWEDHDPDKLAQLTLDELRAAPAGLDRAIYDRCSPERKLVLWQEKLNEELASGGLTTEQRRDLAELKTLLRVEHFAQRWVELPPVYAKWMAHAREHFRATRLHYATGTLMSSTAIPLKAINPGGTPQLQTQTCPCSNSRLELSCNGQQCLRTGGCAVTRTGCGFLGLGGCDGWCP